MWVVLEEKGFKEFMEKVHMDHKKIENVTNYIFMNDTPGKSDVIFIPVGSNNEVVQKAAELYHGGYAPYILVSGHHLAETENAVEKTVIEEMVTEETVTEGTITEETVIEKNVTRGNTEEKCDKRNYAAECEYYRDILMEEGVPEDAIWCEERATSLMESAWYSAGVVRALGVKIERAIICCQAYQARRAYKSYAYQFKGIELMVVPVETYNITSKDWWKDEQAVRLVMGEMEKCGRFYRDYESEVLSTE